MPHCLFLLSICMVKCVNAHMTVHTTTLGSQSHVGFRKNSGFCNLHRLQWWCVVTKFFNHMKFLFLRYCFTFYFFCYKCYWTIQILYTYANPFLVIWHLYYLEIFLRYSSFMVSEFSLFLILGNLRNNDANSRISGT